MNDAHAIHAHEPDAIVARSFCGRTVRIVTADEAEAEPEGATRPCRHCIQIVASKLSLFASSLAMLGRTRTGATAHSAPTIQVGENG